MSHVNMFTRRRGAKPSCTERGNILLVVLEFRLRPEVLVPPPPPAREHHINLWDTEASKDYFSQVFRFVKRIQFKLFG